MRPIFSLLAIGFFAFAFVSFAKYSDGMILFRGFGYQVEFSLMMFIILQIGLIYIFIPWPQDTVFCAELKEKSISLFKESPRAKRDLKT